MTSSRSAPSRSTPQTWPGSVNRDGPTRQQILRGAVHQPTAAGKHPPPQDCRPPRGTDRRRSSGRRAGNHRDPVDGNHCPRRRVRRRSGHRRVRPELTNSGLARKQTHQRGPHDRRSMHMSGTPPADTGVTHRSAGIPGVLIASTPTTPTGGLAISIEDGHWLIGALGVGDNRPPRDIAGFEAFLAGLRDPALARIAQRLEPVSDVHLHRQTANRRRHYDQLNDWPDGVIVMGDAFCAFNPVYGQGIAVGACEAILVRDAINNGMTPGGAGTSFDNSGNRSRCPGQLPPPPTCSTRPVNKIPPDSARCRTTGPDNWRNSRCTATKGPPTP